MHGNQYQAGFPDLFCYHPDHKLRLIEVKTKKGRLTPAQYAQFKKLEQFNCAVYVLTAKDQYPLLFKPGNWREWEHKVDWSKVKKEIENEMGRLKSGGKLDDWTKIFPEMGH